MSLASGVSVGDDVVGAFNEFRTSANSKGDRIKFVIFKISDNKKDVVVDEASKETDYEVFRNKLADARDDKGNPAPRYAVYDVDYEIPNEGKRSKIVFIAWVPDDAPTLWRMVYASTKEDLKRALKITSEIHADDKSDIEWKTVLADASNKKAAELQN
jgi:cofilin